jgi:hypothetical protein
MAVLLLIAALVAVSAWQARSFRLDASSDSLLLEEDESLRYYRTVRARYGSDDFLIVTYTPAAALFDPETLADLGRLRDELSALKRVDSVTSILDVPLIRSPPVSLSELQKQVPTLESPGSDKTLARQELLTSPLYRNLLISPDGGTTALQINLHRSTQYSQLLERRSALREERLQQPLP